MSTAEAEAENLISHLSRALHPADREAFRQAAVDRRPPSIT